MARWLILYSNHDGDPKSAIVNDPDGSNFPFGTNAEDVLTNHLPDRNDGGSTFLVELGPEGEPMVVSDDEEIERKFIDL